MLLSIVIPTKNRPEYLSQILGSIHSQISKSIATEILIIDDGSKEKLLIKNREICEKHKFKLLEQKISKGSGEARNRGIQEAKGEWIAFLDDDVILDNEWFSNVIKRLNSLDSNIIGIEGKVISKGNGLWDKEVENITGKLYLTANIIYKKAILISAGYFDDRFLKYGEDQELALRMKFYGEIIFDSSLVVTHLPRNINFSNIILDSLNRINSLLNSEYFLYKKFPAHYHTIRYSNSFWGTLINIILKHTFISLKRRSFKNLQNKPFQTFYLLISSILEQFGALLFFPKFIIKEVSGSSKIPNSINIEKSCKLNKVSTVNLIKLIRSSQSSKIISRIILGKRNYNNVITKLNKISKFKSPNLILRIDDLFLEDKDKVKNLCSLMLKHKVNFLAGITLSDLYKTENNVLIEEIKYAGGIIAIHGINHKGKYGPYPSEILQLNYNEINSICQKSNMLKLKIFIPPFNAISWDQIEYLSNSFSIICGGPESGRFTNHISIPVILKSGSLYLPSLPPFYNTSKKLINRDNIFNQNGLKAVTLHLNNEYEDNFNSLNILLSKHADNFINIEEFIERYINE